jgi:hypothetical protein
VDPPWRAPAPPVAAPPDPPRDRDHPETVIMTVVPP